MNDPLVYKKRFNLFVVCSVLIFVFLIFSSLDSNFKKNFFKPKISLPSLIVTELTSKSIYILDSSNGNVLFEKEGAVKRPLASVSKIMTAVVALQYLQNSIIEATIPNLAYRNNEVYTIDQRENWQIENLVKLMITKSSNEAAEEIARFSSTRGYDFIELMNQKAKELNLWKTSFKNSSGLDINSNLASNIGTAEDTAFLMRYAITTYPQIFENVTLKGYNAMSEAGTVYFVENTNKLAGSLPGLIAAKTGYTELAGGNLAFAVRMKDDRIIIVVLLGSTKEERFNDAQKISSALTIDFDNYYKQK